MFFVEGSLPIANQLEEDYPLRQTQALMIVLDELEAWVDQAQTCMGSEPLRCLDAHRDWLFSVKNHVMDVRDAIDEEEDEDVPACPISADHGLYDALDTLIDSCPSEDEITDNVRGGALAKALVSMTEFWLINILQHLKRLQSYISGDDELSAFLKRQKTLAMLSF